MSDFAYTTIEQQIQKLKSQHLIIEDERKAKAALRTYGYYNIINGYRDPYIVRNYDKKTYCPGVTFNQIFSLFRLDHIIRNAVMTTMVDLEEHLRAVTAEIIGESFGSDHTQYLEINKYRDRTVNNPRFRRNNLLQKLNDLANSSDKEPIRYYRETHHIVPPWILLKGTDFATLVNYVRLFKKPEREKLVYALYGPHVTEQKMEEYKDFLSDTLSLCLEYRNLAAHGGRIYNYIPSSNVRITDGTHPSAGLGTLVYCLSAFGYSQPYDMLTDSLNQVVSEYYEDYPHDIQRLERATGLQIELQKYLWVNEQSGIYHTNPTCSGSSKNKKVLVSDIDLHNLKPCKKCGISINEINTQ